MKQHEIKKSTLSVTEKLRQKLLDKIMMLLKEYDPGAMILLSIRLYGFKVFISQTDNKKRSVEILKTKKRK